VGDDAFVCGTAHVTGEAVIGEQVEISQNAKIGGNAQIMGNAKIYGNAKVDGFARVCENAEVSGDACVEDDAIIRGCVLVCGAAHIGGHSHICGDVTISGNAQIGGADEGEKHAFISKPWHYVQVSPAFERKFTAYRNSFGGLTFCYCGLFFDEEGAKDKWLGQKEHIPTPMTNEARVALVRACHLLILGAD
jgi:UDP-3-O-[3-hydroxymyristoyl] glucosamine N-acyltransferase